MKLSTHKTSHSQICMIVFESLLSSIVQKQKRVWDREPTGSYIAPPISGYDSNFVLKLFTVTGVSALTQTQLLGPGRVFHGLITCCEKNLWRSSSRLWCRTIGLLCLPGQGCSLA